MQHGKRADSIVKNMLLHSREGSGEHRPTDINVIVEESLNLAYHGARAEKPGFDITLERNLDPAAGMIDAYPSRNYPSIPQPDFQRFLCRHQAQGGGKWVFRAIAERDNKGPWQPSGNPDTPDNRLEYAGGRPGRGQPVLYHQAGDMVSACR